MAQMTCTLKQYPKAPELSLTLRTLFNEVADDKPNGRRYDRVALKAGDKRTFTLAGSRVERTVKEIHALQGAGVLEVTTVG